jgi:uncharacterized protein involved in exopolysaccharide biosynthesis
MNWNTILEVGSFLGIAAFVLAQVVNGRSARKSNDITDAERTIQLFKDRITALENRLTETVQNLAGEHDNVIRLQTQLLLKDQTIKEYLDILQNRDPALTEFIKSTSTTMNALLEGMNRLLGAEQKEKTVTVTTK